MRPAGSCPPASKRTARPRLPHTRSFPVQPWGSPIEREDFAMQIRVGFEMAYACPQPTPMLLVLNVHHSRASDLVRPDLVLTTPAVPLLAYRDLFGNWCSRIVAPAGRIVISTEAVVNDSGLPD